MRLPTQMRRLNRSLLKAAVFATAVVAVVLSVQAPLSAATSGVRIVGNNAAFGAGPIQTYDLSAGTLVNSFVPDGASGSNNGRALAVVGNEVFYTELGGGFGASDAIHVAPFNGGVGGSDIRTIPNPAPSTGVQDLDYWHGALYALSGYPSGTLQVWKLDPQLGAVLAGPIAIPFNSGPDADGFTVLPNGDFLINTGDGSCTYNEYDAGTGVPTSHSLTVPGAGSCTGVATDGKSLYFQTDFNSFTQTDMSGNLIARTNVGGDVVEDVSIISPGPVYVALGDSYAAGEGLGGFEPGTAVNPNPVDNNANVLKNTCHRSQSSGYGSVNSAKPIVLPNLPNWQRQLWACSGARATDMMIAQGSLPINDPYYQYGQPAQTSTVDGSTKWISVSAGGNDLQFSLLGKACVVYTWGKKVNRISFSDPDLKGSCETQVAFEKAKLPALAANLRTLYSTLLDNAPNAALGVVGYPKIFPSDYSLAYTTTQDKVAICATNVLRDQNGAYFWAGIPVSDAKSIDTNILQRLNATAKSVVQALAKLPQYAGRIAFADPYHRSDDVPFNCDGGTRNQTVNGLVLSLAGHGLAGGWQSKLISTATFHPTKAGQQVLGRALQAAFVSTHHH